MLHVHKNDLGTGLDYSLVAHRNESKRRIFLRFICELFFRKLFFRKFLLPYFCTVFSQIFVTINLFLGAMNNTLHSPPCSLTELFDRELPQLLRLLPPSLLPSRERAELCLVQEEHGPQVDPTLSRAHGLPVHVRHSPGRKLWRAPNATQVCARVHVGPVNACKIKCYKIILLLRLYFMQ